MTVKAGSSAMELFRKYLLPDELDDNKLKIPILNNTIVLSSDGLADGATRMFSYRRHINENTESQTLIASEDEKVAVGIFPVPPLFVPKRISNNVYLKFDAPLIVEQKKEIEFYAKIPIDIGVYRQSKDEEILIDVFSAKKPRYALYGTPERGAVCRYGETSIAMEPINAKKYEEASVKIRIKNSIDNIVKVSKVVIPMKDVVLDHAQDSTMMAGLVEMTLDSAFGKEIINVRLIDAKVKRTDKTSVVAKEETRLFTMDAGY